ncbi:MAG: CPBP family intramembrane metalloprotease [Brevibacillus sp.]|nr:CPBP family intramembrane metalloprotease [Brevibacillus sp.]
MFTGPGIEPDLGTVPRRSKRWAILLLSGYLFQLAFELSLIRFTPGGDGRWVAYLLDEPTPLMMVLLLAVSVVSLFAGIQFVIHLYREKASGKWMRFSTDVDGTDVLYVLAWLHILNTLLLFLYGFFLPYPLFPDGTIGGLLESASLQLFILLIAFFWFRGRGESIGFRRPSHLGRMLVMLTAMFLFIVVALDALVTDPVADFFQLSLESEREKGIENEILQAKETNWLNGVWAIAVIGVMVPIAEEIMFRGVIQTYLVKRWGTIAGIVLTSFWFALIHIDIALFVPLFAIGVALGVIRHRYRSLWGPILLHSLNNLTSMLYYYS